MCSAAGSSAAAKSAVLQRMTYRHAHVWKDVKEVYHLDASSIVSSFNLETSQQSRDVGFKLPTQARLGIRKYGSSMKACKSTLRCRKIRCVRYSHRLQAHATAARLQIEAIAVRRFYHHDLRVQRVYMSTCKSSEVLRALLPNLLKKRGPSPKAAQVPNGWSTH